MRDITSVIAAVVAFLVTAILGYVIIPYLRKLKFGQTILEDGPKWHKDKQGTPTMGGIMIVAGVLIGIILAFFYSSIAETSFVREFKNTIKFTNFIAGIFMALYAVDRYVEPYSPSAETGAYSC